MPQLSIIIIHYNVPELLEKCILSILQSVTTFEFEILVIDNHSEKYPINGELKNQLPQVKWYENPTNLGFSKACNIGADLATGKFLLFVNPDTIFPDPLTLQKVYDFYYTKEKIGALGVRITDEEGNFRPESKRNLPTALNAFRKLFGSFLCWVSNGKTYYKSDISEFDTAPVEVLTGAFLWIEKSKFLEVGGFDERYFMYAEDIDLCKSLIERGFMNYYFGETSIIHYKGKCSPKNGAYYAMFFGAMKQFVKKHYSNVFIRNFILIGINIRWMLARCILKKNRIKR